MTNLVSFQQLFPADSEDQLKANMAKRNAAIQSLWDGGIVGEAHTGLVAPKGQLNADQQTLIAAENADRSQLYAAEAKQKGTTAEQVALSYFVARLGYAKPGAWVEKYDKTTASWNWVHWGQ